MRQVSKVVKKAINESDCASSGYYTWTLNYDSSRYDGETFMESNEHYDTMEQCFDGGDAVAYEIVPEQEDWMLVLNIYNNGSLCKSFEYTFDGDKVFYEEI